MDFALATTPEITRELGRRLRAQRLARGMTQQALAARAGVALGALKKLESTGLVTLETFVRIVQTLSLGDELHDILVLRPQASIAEMLRAESAQRQRAPRAPRTRARPPEEPSS